MIDGCDAKRVALITWQAQDMGSKGWYVHGHLGTERGKKQGVSLHRFILNAPPNRNVDHIDGDGLNNRRGNLRLSTNQQNSWNRRGHGSSKYVGVYFHHRLQKWAAQIAPNKKAIWLGVFESEQEAARARDTAAIEHYGEFARLNFPKAVPA